MKLIVLNLHYQITIFSLDSKYIFKQDLFQKLLIKLILLLKKT